MRLVCPLTPLGTLRCADVPKVLAANVSKTVIPVEKWDEIVAARPSDGTCKGIFFSSYRTKHFHRRCDATAATDGLCVVCSEMRDKAKDKAFVSGEGVQAYDVVEKAIWSREGVQQAIFFWDNEADKVWKSRKGEDEFPFFTAKEVAKMILFEGGVIANKAQNKSYRRSRIIVEAQDAHLRRCMFLILQILKKESKKSFLKRWKVIKRTAIAIGEQMYERRGEDEQVGAIQAPDIVREELERAYARGKSPSATKRFISLEIKRLAEWAGTRAKTGDDSSDVSTPSPTKKVVRTKAAHASATPLRLTRVGGRRTDRSV